MAGSSIVDQLSLWPVDAWPPKKPAKRPSLHAFWLEPERLPAFVRDCLPVMRCLDLFGPLDWDGVPERDLVRNWGQTTTPHTALIGALLVQLLEGHRSTHALHTYLIEHPAFIWLLGFPLQLAPNTVLGFNARDSLPSHLHLDHLRRVLPNISLQFLLADSVRLTRSVQELTARELPGSAPLNDTDLKIGRIARPDWSSAGAVNRLDSQAAASA